VSVAISRTLPRGGGRLEHLDFGAGAGVTSQLFSSLGYRTTLADISSSLLAFARFRLERRGTSATYVDLNSQRLDAVRYDVITAIDTLVHVPDIAGTSKQLHDALRPGGMLFANFDVRPKSTDNGNAWHLYDDDRPLRWTLHRAGFEEVESLDGLMTLYREVPPRGLAYEVRGARDLVMLRSPVRRWYRAVKQTARDRLRSRLSRSGRPHLAAGADRAATERP
jgi:SAM-dependent methyltransferase